MMLLFLLAKRKIIRYVPGDVKPYIVYYQPRLPLSYITIGREAYENRKELFVTKIRGHGPLYPG